MKTKFLFHLKRSFPLFIILAVSILIVLITDKDFIEDFFRFILIGNHDMLNIIFILIIMVMIFKFLFPRLYSWTQETYTQDLTDVKNDNITNQ